MRDPYRVIVWGTGGVGKVVLREIVNRPEFELVGCYGHSKSKQGKDAAETVLNQEPVGVNITNDVDEILALDADVVMYCGAFPIGSIGKKMEINVERLLESGKNVISCAGHHYPPAHGEEYARRLKDACMKGSSSLHGTGENPGFWLERLAVTLCGATNKVHSLHLNEYADCAKPGDKADPSVMGFARDPADAAIGGPVGDVWNRYYFVETLNLVSLALYGKEIDRFEVDPDLYVAEEEIVMDTSKGDPIDFVVPKGKVKAITNNYRAYIDGENKITISGNWYLSKKHSPFGAKEEVWEIEIEGDPVSFACTVEAYASLKERTHRQPGDTTTPTWFVTGIAMVQTIPRVVEAKPGFVYASAFTHATPDFRLLENRESIAG
jgi:2,4-diaminopentanoate dehydrogenase